MATALKILFLHMEFLCCSDCCFGNSVLHFRYVLPRHFEQHTLMAHDMPLSLASQTLFICHSRFRELKSWLIVLTWGGNGRNHPNVSVAERLSTLKHSVWAKLVAGIVIGATVGFLVLFYHRSVSAYVLEMAYVVTNDILRIGCVCLMGVPAGFKLNTELARAIGTLSLNLVQAWSTLGIFIASFVVSFLLNGRL